MFSWRRSRCHRTKFEYSSQKPPVGFGTTTCRLLSGCSTNQAEEADARKRKIVICPVQLHVCLAMIKSLIRMPAPSKAAALMSHQL
jgi:hypothetical protein